MALKRALITGITGQDGSYLAEGYLTFAVRSDALIKPWAAGPLREKFEALSATTLVRRLRFTDPESAIAQLNGA